MWGTFKAALVKVVTKKLNTYKFYYEIILWTV